MSENICNYCKKEYSVSDMCYYDKCIYCFRKNKLYLPDYEVIINDDYSFKIYEYDLRIFKADKKSYVININTYPIKPEILIEKCILKFS